MRTFLSSSFFVLVEPPAPFWRSTNTTASDGRDRDAERIGRRLGFQVSMQMFTFIQSRKYSRVYTAIA